jgi:hypothetical protein
MLHDIHAFLRNEVTLSNPQPNIPPTQQRWESPDEDITLQDNTLMERSLPPDD